MSCGNNSFFQFRDHKGLGGEGEGVREGEGEGMRGEGRERGRGGTEPERACGKRPR